MKKAGQFIRCIGCGGLVPDLDGPTHPYIGASPGCWRIFGEVLAKEFGEYRYPAVHRLTVDAYAASHPGVPSRRSIQSVAVHLIRLCASLELHVPPEELNGLIRRAVLHAEKFVWLEPPGSIGDLTIVDVSRAQSLPEHERLVRAWAESVWKAWGKHHDQVRRWAGFAGQAG